MSVSKVETDAVAWLIGKNKTFDVPPPGGGLTTAMEAVLTELTSEANMEADNCDELIKVVTRVLPFQVTADPATKPVPFTVSVKLALPGATVVGSGGALINGTGLVCAAERVETTRSASDTAERNHAENGVNAERVVITLLCRSKGGEVRATPKYEPILLQQISGVKMKEFAYTPIPPRPFS
jgi:hypothetical protein